MINRRFFPFSGKAANARRSEWILWKPAECSKTDFANHASRPLPGHHPTRIDNFNPRGDPVLCIPRFLWKVFKSVQPPSRVCVSAEAGSAGPRRSVLGPPDCLIERGRRYTSIFATSLTFKEKPLSANERHRPRSGAGGTTISISPVATS